MKTFKDYFIGSLLHPRRTFEALLTDDRRLKFGLYAISINAILCVYFSMAWQGSSFHLNTVAGDTEGCLLLLQSVHACS